jgi:hypothetical protein
LIAGDYSNECNGSTLSSCDALDYIPMAERDDSGRKILGKSSSGNSLVVRSTNGVPARRVLGQSTTGAVASEQNSVAEGLGRGRTGGNLLVDRDRRKRRPRIKTLVLIVIGLLVDFFSPEEMVQSICRLLENPNLSKELGQSARRKIVSQYDLKTRCLPAQLDWVHKLAGT